MKVAIIGHSGAGKSTLAEWLGQQYHYPVLHLDKLNFEAGWVERDREEAKALAKAFMDENDHWIIEGNYKWMDQKRRLEEADWIFILDLPRFVCFKQAYGRYRRLKGTTRSSMAAGCEEKFDFEFMKWILWDSRGKTYKAAYKRIVDTYDRKVVICKKRSDTKMLMACSADRLRRLKHD